MGLAHGYMFGLDCDSLTIDRAAYCVAQDNVPLVVVALILGYEAAVLVARSDFL